MTASRPLHSVVFDFARGEHPSPWLLKHACAINGFCTRDPGKGFTYCEIGAADGNDLLLMAAANPEGRFWGINTDGASCGAVDDTRRASTVGNCTLHTLSPAELGSLKIPPVDFLVLTGVLSGDRAAQGGLLSFAAKNLKPGGVVLCTYRTPHAWGFWEPVIHFLKAAADLPGDRLENLQQGLRELQGLRESGAALFQISPLVEAFLDGIAEFDLRDFDRALLQAPCRTRHFDEVCRDMEGIGLRYAGGLPLAANYPQIALPANLKDRLSALPGLRLRETWKDLVRMPFFRQDVFTSALPADRPELPAETVLGSHLRREQFRFDFEVPGAASVRFDGPLFQALADLLAQNAMRLPAILSSAGLAAFPPAEILSALAWMTAMEQIQPFACAVPDDGGAKVFRLSRFNAAEVQRQLARPHGDVALASWTLGNGMAMNPREALALLALSEAGPQDAEAWAGRWLVNHALPVVDGPDDPPLGQLILHARANPRALAVLGLSEKDSRIEPEVLV